jgi:hypothetical protein
LANVTIQPAAVKTASLQDRPDPPLGCNLKPEAMTTNHVNGLAQLLEQARKQVSTLEVAN